MVKTDSNYIRGSVAEKLEYDVYEENKVLKAKKKARSYTRVKLKTVLAVLYVFVLGFIVMYRYALITEINYRISSLEAECDEIEKDNSRLKLAVDKAMDLDTVKELAIARLGMQEPDNYQKVYISVRRDDFTSVSSSYLKADTKEKNMFAMFTNRVGRLLGLAY